MDADRRRARLFRLRIAVGVVLAGVAVTAAVADGTTWHIGLAVAFAALLALTCFEFWATRRKQQRDAELDEMPRGQ